MGDKERFGLKLPPSEYFRKLYFDTLTHSVPALNALVEQAGANRVQWIFIAVSVPA